MPNRKAVSRWSEWLVMKGPFCVAVLMGICLQLPASQNKHWKTFLLGKEGEHVRQWVTSDGAYQKAWQLFLGLLRALAKAQSQEKKHSNFLAVGVFVCVRTLIFQVQAMLLLYMLWHTQIGLEYHGVSCCVSHKRNSQILPNSFACSTQLRTEL